ncbi:DNA-binding response OmpR family regulator [Loktanella sp. PT4BL]|jgi:DNA-binding response OmpR family regulator|uniref:response regulator n=1 Tax=Loktanella sp. PT4BL TaxID=2135611 RepID=UPI000D775AF9|nr:response regulator [Loktanella sp. PT4BL]PXW68039.1 DNA-binding response OmpR family regulator [Loktanella sp. PT4BL]
MTVSQLLLLLVDDDPGIRDLLGDFLLKEGFALETASDASEMDAKLACIHPDLIVLDLMLPGEDGVSICRRLSRDGAPPIIMLTAKNDEIDRIIGLEMGADDYVAKPFAPRELLARIRAVLRRTAMPKPVDINQRFAFDRFVIDVDARQLFGADETRIALTSGEFDLLACFVDRPRRVLSRDQILDALRGRGAEPFDRSVDMLVSRLRRKLTAHGADQDLISTVRNAGYLLTSPVKSIS